MSKLFYFCGFGVCFVVLCLLEGCSSTIYFERGSEKAKFEQNYKPIILQVEELKKFPDMRVFDGVDVTIYSLYVTRRASSFEDFFDFVSEEVLVCWKLENTFPHLPFQKYLKISYYSREDSVTHTFKQEILIEIPEGSKFIGIEYLGSGKFEIKHEYKAPFSFKLLFLRFMKLVLIFITGILISILLCDLGWFKMTMGSKSSS